MHQLLNCPKSSNKHQQKQIANIKILTSNKQVNSKTEEKH